MPNRTAKKYSKTITAPKGANMKAYSATKSRSFMAKAGNIPAKVANVPASNVALVIDNFGKTA